MPNLVSRIKKLFRDPVPSMKLHEIFQFQRCEAPIACLSNSNFRFRFWDNFKHFYVLELKQRAQKISTFLQSSCVYGIKWSLSKFYSSNFMLKMSNFSRTESFDELNWNSQSFSARIAGWEISKFLPTDSVYGITWNISNLKARISCKFFQSFHELVPCLRILDIFQIQSVINLLSENVKFLRSGFVEITWKISKFHSSKILPKKSTFFRVGSVREISWHASKLRSSKWLHKKFNLFANRFLLWKYLK